LHLINEDAYRSVVFSENKNAFHVSLKNNLIDESSYQSIDIF